MPTCESDKECAAKWAAARRWVLDNCSFKLQHITDDFLETYNSTDYASTGMWCRVTKSPVSDTAYRIEVETGINNAFAFGKAESQRQWFNDFVNDSWHSP